MSSSDDELGDSPRVGLLSSDLLVRSRVGTSLAGRVARVEAITAEELTGAFDLVLVDLNRDQEGRLAWLGRLAETQPEVEVICFGPHTEMARLSPAARAAGASRCVANSHLAETLQHWVRSRGGAPPRPRRASA